MHFERRCQASNRLPAFSNSAAGRSFVLPSRSQKIYSGRFGKREMIEIARSHDHQGTSTFASSVKIDFGLREQAAHPISGGPRVTSSPTFGPRHDAPAMTPVSAHHDLRALALEVPVAPRFLRQSAWRASRNTPV